MSFTRRTVQGIPVVSDAAGVGFETDASTIVYLKGPAVVFLKFSDDQGGQYNFPITPGDQYRLPSGRRVDRRCEVYGVEATTGSAEFIVGNGDYTTAKGEGGTEAPRYVSTGGKSQASAGSFAAIGLNNPADSGFVFELLGVTLFPQSTDDISMQYIASEGNGSYFDTSNILNAIRLIPYDEGDAAIEFMLARDSAGFALRAALSGDAVTTYWGSVIGIQESVQLNFETTPVILPPDSMLVFSPAVQNVALSAIFRGRERRA